MIYFHTLTYTSNIHIKSTQGHVKFHDTNFYNKFTGIHQELNKLIQIIFIKHAYNQNYMQKFIIFLMKHTYNESKPYEFIGHQNISQNNQCP